MDDLFEKRWSEMGSNNRADENRVVAYWRDYFQRNRMQRDATSPKPSVEFQRGRNTRVNCNSRIPLHRSYEDFKSDMDFAIRNTQGFGRE